jgi:uncharacterized membrane protein YeiH
MLLTVLDLLSVFAFALSGGLRGVERRLDVFGVVFLAFVAATMGGILRDLLIGATPPAAIENWTYAATSIAAGLLCFFAYGLVARVSTPVALFDAIGLGFSVVVGTRKALDFGLSPAAASLIGMLTAIGGGLVRDILTARTPMVLQKDIYALAALAGAVVIAFGDSAGNPSNVTALLGGTLATTLRLVALRYNWQLPTSGPI